MKQALIPILATACLACQAAPSTSQSVSRVETSIADACAEGADATAQVQAAMTASRCLPPGTYVIDTPRLGPNGRRRDAMLVGGTLCGVRQAHTTVRFRGDASRQFWVGVMNADVRGVRLESGCVTNTIEQTHLVRASVGITVSDAVLAHPARDTSAGDSVNVVGSVAAPVVGLVVDHVVFESCARFGVQMSAYATAPRIGDSTFGEGCGIGSEGQGTLTDVRIDHNAFNGTTRRLALNLQRMARLSLYRNRVRGHGVFLMECDDCRIEHNVIEALGPWLSGDFVSAIRVADVANRLVITDNVIDQSGTSATAAILIGPLRTNRQAYLADVEISDNEIRQLTAAPFVVAAGVAGLRVTRNRLEHAPGPAPAVLIAGPSSATPPAVSVPSTDVVETDNAVHAAN